MTGNYTGSPHTNNNYPQNPNNNARQGSGAQKNTQGEQFSITWKAGESDGKGQMGPGKGGMPKQGVMPAINLANGLGLGNFIRPRYGRFA